jgi:hypothetical protein
VEPALNLDDPHGAPSRRTTSSASTAGTHRAATPDARP